MSDQTKSEPGSVTAEPAVDSGLGGVVGKGTTWMMLGAAFAKATSFIAQVWLGHLLTDIDFGVFATASAIGWFLAILRDAGTNAILLQKGPGEYERYAGALFWMGMAFAVGTGLLLALAAYPIALAMHQPEIAPILWVIAAAGVFNTPASQQQTKLRQDFRFRDFTIIQTISAIVRQIATVVLAKAHFGAMSFAWPYIICAIYELIAGARATKEKPWTRPADRHLWPGLLRQGLWTIAGSCANFALDQGPYFVLGVLTFEKITGQFYFAFQLTAQVGVLMSYAVQLVLAPVFVRLNDDPKRQGEAMVRALRAMMLSGSIACISLSVTIEPLETALWHGKWAMVVLPVMILGVAYPWRITFGLTTAILHAQGRFKRHAFLTALEGAGLMAAIAISALVSKEDLVLHAIAAGAWLMVGRLGVTLYFMIRMLSVPARSTLAALVPSWALACLAGGAVIWADRKVNLGGFCKAMTKPLEGLIPAGRIHDHVHASGPHVVHAAILGLVCGAVFMALARVILHAHVRDTVGVAPARVRRAFSTLLFLGEL